MTARSRSAVHRRRVGRAGPLAGAGAGEVEGGSRDRLTAVHERGRSIFASFYQRLAHPTTERHPKPRTRCDRLGVTIRPRSIWGFHRGSFRTSTMTSNISSAGSAMSIAFSNGRPFQQTTPHTRSPPNGCQLSQSPRCRRAAAWPPARLTGQECYGRHADGHRAEDQLQDAETEKRNLEKQLRCQQCTCHQDGYRRPGRALPRQPGGQTRWESNGERQPSGRKRPARQT
jgi:hypothetical protein